MCSARDARLAVAGCCSRAAAAAATEGPHCFRLRFAVVRLGVRVAGEEKCGNVRVADQRAEISSEPRVRMFGDQAVRRVHRHIERDDVTVDGKGTVWPGYPPRDPNNLVSEYVSLSI